MRFLKNLQKCTEIKKKLWYTIESPQNSRNAIRKHKAPAAGEKTSTGLLHVIYMQNSRNVTLAKKRAHAAGEGFGTSLWMNEVLAQFDNIVENVANAARLQEEASILVLRIAKLTSAKVHNVNLVSCLREM